MTIPFAGTTTIPLPEDRGSLMQSGGTWRDIGKGKVIVICPECWAVSHKYHKSTIGFGVVRVKCECGLDKDCSLTGWEGGLKGGTD